MSSESFLKFAKELQAAKDDDDDERNATTGSTATNVVDRKNNCNAVNGGHNKETKDKNDNDDDQSDDDDDENEFGFGSFVSSSALEGTTSAKKSIPPNKKHVQNSSITRRLEEKEDNDKHRQEQQRLLKSLGKRTRKSLQTELSKRKQIKRLDDVRGDTTDDNDNGNLHAALLLQQHHKDKTREKSRRTTTKQRTTRRSPSTTKRQQQKRRKTHDDEEEDCSRRGNVLIDRWLPPHYVKYYLSDNHADDDDDSHRSTNVTTCHPPLKELFHGDDEDDSVDDDNGSFVLDHPLILIRGGYDHTSHIPKSTQYVTIHGIPLGYLENITNEFVTRHIFRGLEDDIEDIFTLYPLNNEDDLIEELDIPPARMKRSNKDKEDHSDTDSSYSTSSSKSDKQEELWGWNKQFRCRRSSRKRGRTHRHQRRKHEEDGWIVPRLNPSAMRLVVKFKSTTSAQLAMERTGELVTFTTTQKGKSMTVKVALLIVPLPQPIGDLLQKHLRLSLKQSPSSKNDDNKMENNSTQQSLYRIMWCFVAYTLGLKQKKKFCGVQRANREEEELSFWNTLESFFWRQQDDNETKEEEDSSTLNIHKILCQLEFWLLQHCGGLTLARAVSPIQPATSNETYKKQQEDPWLIPKLYHLTKELQKDLYYQHRRRKAT